MLACRYAKLLPKNRIVDFFPILLNIIYLHVFYRHNVLERSSGLLDMGGLPWHTTVALIVANTVVLFGVLKGIRSTGKVGSGASKVVSWLGKLSHLLILDSSLRKVSLAQACYRPTRTKKEGFREQAFWFWNQSAKIGGLGYSIFWVDSSHCKLCTKYAEHIFEKAPLWNGQIKTPLEIFFIFSFTL